MRNSLVKNEVTANLTVLSNQLDYSQEKDENFVLGSTTLIIRIKIKL